MAMASSFDVDGGKNGPPLSPLLPPKMVEGGDMLAELARGPLRIPFVANRPDVQDAVNAAHDRLGMVSVYLRDVVRETLSFRKAGLAMAKATDGLATYLMDADALEAPAKVEAFLDESRGGTGWGTEDAVHWSAMGLGALGAGGLGGGGHGAGNAPLPTATRGTGGERLLGSLTPVLVQFGRLLREQAASQDQFMAGLQKSFVEPMEAYTREENGKLAEVRKAWNATEEVYVASLEKYLHGPMKQKNLTDDVLDQRAAELAKAHHDAQQARFEMVKQLSVAEGNKYLQVADCVLSTVNVIDSYCHQSVDLVDTYTPYKEALRDQTERVRAALDAAEGPWEAQRAKLQAAVALSKETLEVLGVLPGSSGSPVSGGSGSHTVSPRTPRPPVMNRGTLRGLEGAKLAAALRHAATVAEARHQCFEQVKKMEQVYTPHVTPGCVKEGYLFKKSSSKMLQVAKHWNRRWFVLDGSKLYYLKDDASRQKILICDVLLCSVKEVNYPDALYCFEVISANRRSYTLQAEGPDELKSWVTTMRDSISSQIQQTGGPDTAGGGGSGGGSSGLVTSSGIGSVTWGGSSGPGFDTEDTSDDDMWHKGGNGVNGLADNVGRREQNSLVEEVMRDNPECADCGAPNPDWVSLNLGVLVCIECSGIHRSLGTHVSKVRSLDFDALDEVDLSVLRDVGNAKSNSIWEHSLTQWEGWEKPSADSPPDLKRRYVHAKYVWKGFVEGSSTTRDSLGGQGDLARIDGGGGAGIWGGAGGSAESGRREGLDGGGAGGAGGGGGQGTGRAGIGTDRWSLRLSECAAAGDLTGAVEALAHGGNPRWANPDDQGRTALHCAAATGDLRCCEFLIQNGADVFAVDGRDLSPLDVSVLENKVPAAEYFTRKMDLLR